MGGEYPDRDPQMFYELARDRHAAQAEGLNVLDTKLVFFTSSSSALLAILIAVYALRPNAFDAWWEFVLPIASGVAWLLLTALALDVYKPKKWRGGPELQDAFDRHFSEDDDSALKWRVANHFWHDYNDNEPLVTRKVWALKWARRLFVTQTVLLVAALVLVALSDSDTSRRCQSPLAAARDARVSLGPVALAPVRELRAGSDPSRPRSSRGSLTASYAASGTALARLSACASRASIVRAASQRAFLLPNCHPTTVTYRDSP